MKLAENITEADLLPGWRKLYRENLKLTDLTPQQLLFTYFYAQEMLGCDTDYEGDTDG